MSLTILQQSSYNAAKSAFEATFQNEKDVNGIADLFALKWSSEYALGIKTFISSCFGLPIGGNIIIGNIAQLTIDLYNAAKSAFEATFQNEKDVNGIADLFASGISTMSASIGSYIVKNLTLPPIPPSTISPGGLLITIPSTELLSSYNNSAELGFINTFLSETDTNGLAKIFALEFMKQGDDIYTYLSTCVSPPGGGFIITT